MAEQGLPRPRMHARHLHARATAAAGAVAVLVVAVTAAVPEARIGHRGLHLQAAVETALSLSALLAAYMLAGRPARSGSRGDTLRAGGFAILALTNFAFGAVPASLGIRDTAFLCWAAPLGAAAGAACLAIAGFVPERRIRLPRPVLTLGLAAAGGVGLAALGALALADAVPPQLHPDVAPRDAEIFGGHTLLILLLALTASLHAAAALSGVRVLTRRPDELVTWVSAGTALAAGGWASYALVPDAATSWVATGDALRFGFYALVLAGAVREIGSYRRLLVDTAVRQERRRIARDMHDGLAQDLAYLVTAVQEDAVDRSAEVREAARRALVETRELLEALAGIERAPSVTLEEAGRVVASLHGIELRYAAEPGLTLSVAERQCLERVLVEAIRNAARHGAAHRVETRIARSDGALTMAVRDDGTGFDPDLAVTGRFGLTSMRERVTALGGRLEIRSAPGAGTTIEVTLPAAEVTLP